MSGNHQYANGAHTGVRWARYALHSRWIQALLGLVLVAAVGLGSVVVVRQAHAATLDVCSTCLYKSINDALTHAAAGDTITVAAGTYGPNETGVTKTDAQITIDKPVTLVGDGAGKSIINAIPTGQPTFTIAPLIQISKPITPGNITISGFTLEGATYNGGGNDYGQLMSIYQDTNAGDVITVRNNLFYSDSTLDPTNRVDQIDSIYVGANNASVNVTNNSFKGVFRAALIEGNPGSFSFTGNDLNLHGLYDSTTSPVVDYWAEGLLFLSDGGFPVNNPQIVSGNTFEAYEGMGVGLDAGYGGGLVGSLNNVSITSNTFNNQGVLGTYSSVPDSADIFLHGFGTSNGPVTSTIWGVTVKGNTFRMNGGSGHGYGVAMKGALGGPISIDHNVMLGSGSSRPLAGVQFISPNVATGVSITHNIITGFGTGLSSDALPSGAQVSATQNCIMGNSTAGATVTSGTALVADQNWWGAASGPKASSNPSGTGNGVSGSITFKPYLTSPAAICAGPVTSKVVASPNQLPAHAAFTLTATESDATTGGFAIASAQFNIHGGQYYPLIAQDGSFNQVTENVFARVAIAAAGQPTVCVQGKDAFGNVGAPSCIVVTILSPAGTPSATATPVATETATATAGAEPTVTAPPTATSTPRPNSVLAFDTGNFPLFPTLIGILLLLVIAAIILFLVISRRRAQE